jgi:hypothetical protein
MTHEMWEKSPGGIWWRQGRLLIQPHPNPPAGQNFHITLDEGGLYYIKGIQFTLTTDANAANRAIVVTFSRFGVEFSRVDSGQATVASTARTYVFGEGLTFTTGSGGAAHSPLPRLFLVPGGTVIASSVVNIQAGDQISGIVLTYLFFPEAGEY